MKQAITKNPEGYSKENDLTPMNVAENRKDRFTKRNFPDIMTSYLNEREVSDYVNQTDPMKESVIVSIVIPVAGHQESQNIYTTLALFLNQDFPKDQYEIVLNVNMPSAITDQNYLDNFDKTIQEINRFKQDNPNVNVTYFNHKYRTDEAKIGTIRRDLTDTAITRHQQRGGEKDHFLISTDADLTKIDPSFIRSHVKALESHEGSAGMVDWDKDSYVEYPWVHVGLRFKQYVESQLRAINGYINCFGSNFGYRASSYCLVGGYPDASVGEDKQFAKEIRDLEKSAIKFTSNARATSDARRMVAVAEKGLAPVEQITVGFSATDSAREGQLKGKNWDYEDPVDVARISKNVENVLKRSMDHIHKTYPEEHNLELFSRALNFLNVAHKLTDNGINGIEITDTKRLIDDLKKFKSKNSNTKMLL